MSGELRRDRRTGAALLLAVAVLCVAPAGCFSYTREQRVQYVELATDPPGLPIATVEGEDEPLPRGRTPVLVEQRYTAFIKHFRRWNWIWPVLFAGATAGSIAWWAKGKSDDVGPRMATLLSVLGLALAVTFDALAEKESGRVGRIEPSILSLEIRPPGGEVVKRRVGLSASASRWKHTIKIADGELAGPASGPVSRPAPPPPPLPRRTVVAAFELEDHANLLSLAVQAQLSGRLVARLAELELTMVPRDRIRIYLEEAATGLRCFPGTCQAQVGRAVGARKTLWTRLQRLGTGCLLRGDLYDLGGATPERTATVPTGCSDAALLAGIDELARRIGASSGDLKAP
jgi:hypothetical protein